VTEDGRTALLIASDGEDEATAHHTHSPCPDLRTTSAAHNAETVNVQVLAACIMDLMEGGDGEIPPGTEPQSLRAGDGPPAGESLGGIPDVFS